MKRNTKRSQLLIAAILLDLVDLGAITAIGAIVGTLLGSLLGWWVSLSLDVRPVNRRWVALGAAVYCLVPFTGGLPLATIVTMVILFKWSGDVMGATPKQIKKMGTAGTDGH